MSSWISFSAASRLPPPRVFGQRPAAPDPQASFDLVRTIEKAVSHARGWAQQFGGAPLSDPSATRRAQQAGAGSLGYGPSAEQQREAAAIDIGTYLDGLASGDAQVKLLMDFVADSASVPPAAREGRLALVVTGDLALTAEGFMLVHQDRKKNPGTAVGLNTVMVTTTYDLVSLPRLLASEEITREAIDEGICQLLDGLMQLSSGEASALGERWRVGGWANEPGPA
jgi:hypothetical protein